MAGIPRIPARALDSLEQLANKAQIVATKLVQARPERRSETLAALLWQAAGGGTVSTARQTGNEMVEQILGQAVPAPLTLAEHNAAELNRRLASLRARGEPIIQLDGRWLRRSHSGKQEWTPVETPGMLVQQRIYRGELDARAATTALARKLGLGSPTRKVDGRDEWADPRLEQHYRRLTAVHAGRVAHDATVEAFRGAVFDQITRVPGVLGWRRLAEPTACGACLALANGRLERPDERRFYLHTRCRCIPVPVTATSPPIPTGREIFDAMSEREQDAAFRGHGGRRKAAALRDGRIQLEDLVKIDEDRIDRTDYVVSERPLRDLALDAPGPVLEHEGLVVGQPPPHADAAVVPERKLTAYALSTTNPTGRNKARVFASALGIGADDWQHLLDELLRGLPGAVIETIRPGRGPAATTFAVTTEVNGLNGRTAKVVSAWRIVDGIPQLVTTYVQG